MLEKVDGSKCGSMPHEAKGENDTGTSSLSGRLAYSYSLCLFDIAGVKLKVEFTARRCWFWCMPKAVATLTSPHNQGVKLLESAKFSSNSGVG